MERLNSQIGPRSKQMLAADQIFAAGTSSSDSVALEPFPFALAHVKCSILLS